MLVQQHAQLTSDQAEPPWWPQPNSKTTAAGASDAETATRQLCTTCCCTSPSVANSMRTTDGGQNYASSALQGSQTPTRGCSANHTSHVPMHKTHAATTCVISYMFTLCIRAQRRVTHSSSLRHKATNHGQLPMLQSDTTTPRVLTRLWQRHPVRVCSSATHRPT